MVVVQLLRFVSTRYGVPCLYKKLQKCQKPLGISVWRFRWTLKKLPSKGSWDRFQTRPQVKHFLGCKKITKSNQCGSLFTRSGALLFWWTKMQNYRAHAFLDTGRLFHVHFVPRFDARDSLPEPETPQIFAPRAWQFVGWQKRKKVGLFQRFFHPSMSIFPWIPTFPTFSNFYYM